LEMRHCCCCSMCCCAVLFAWMWPWLFRAGFKWVINSFIV
jgi:hypothetical protein